MDKKLEGKAILLDDLIADSKPELKTRRLQLIIKESTYRSLKGFCKDNSISVNAFVNRLLEQVLDATANARMVECVVKETKNTERSIKDGERLIRTEIVKQCYFDK